MSYVSREIHTRQWHSIFTTVSTTCRRRRYYSACLWQVVAAVVK